jgi:hypothetical protein
MCVYTHFLPLFFLLSQARAQSLPSQPQIGTKVQLGIIGWGAQVTPLCIFWGQADTSPLVVGIGESGIGRVVLKEEGDQCSNLPGTPPLPFWASAMRAGIPPRGQGPGLVP